MPVRRAERTSRRRRRPSRRRRRRRPGDHGRILRDGVERARSTLEYTALAAAFCPPTFTISELRRVDEVVWGVRLDPRNFHRTVTGADGFVTETDETTTRDGGRPARLYRAGSSAYLHPPLLR